MINIYSNNPINSWAIITKLFLNLYSNKEDDRREMFFNIYGRFLTNFHIKILNSQEFQNLNKISKDAILDLLDSSDLNNFENYLVLEKTLSDLLGDSYSEIFGEEVGRMTVEMIKVIDNNLPSQAKNEFRDFLMGEFT